MISWERKSNEFLMPLWKWGVISDLLREAASWQSRKAARAYARVFSSASVSASARRPPRSRYRRGRALSAPATPAAKFQENNRLLPKWQQKSTTVKKRGQCERFRRSRWKTVNNKIVKNEFPRPMFHFPIRGGVTFMRSTTWWLPLSHSDRRGSRAGDEEEDGDGE